MERIMRIYAKSILRKGTYFRVVFNYFTLLMNIVTINNIYLMLNDMHDYL